MMRRLLNNNIRSSRRRNNFSSWDNTAILSKLACLLLLPFRLICQACYLLVRYNRKRERERENTGECDRQANTQAL